MAKTNIYKLECEEALEFLCEAVWGFAEVNADGDFVWINPAYSKILNAPADLVLGTNYDHWTHKDDIGIDRSLAEQVRSGEIPGYTLAKRYIQRGSTPQRQRVIWGMLSVSGKWSKTGEFLGYRVQFRPYELNEPKTAAIEWKSLFKWGVDNWKMILMILAVLNALIFGGSEKLLDALRAAKEAKESVDGVLPQ
jgi:hypothetical protein